MKRLRHPVRAIREPFGTAGLVVACVALILALTGAAFAAAGLTGKQKKEVEKIAKKYAGKPGAPGATGPQGPAGANGKDGAQGEKGPKGDTGSQGSAGPKGDTGSAGEDGKSAELVKIEPGEAGCEERGGTEVFVEGGEPSEICNGEPGPKGDTGEPWAPENVLPPGATETGAWAFAGTQAAYVAESGGDQNGIQVPISFPIPFPYGLKAAHVHFQGEAEFEKTCPGSAGVPKAEPGELCVYFNNGIYSAPEELFVQIQGLSNSASGASRSGAVLLFSAPTEPVEGRGSFAIRSCVTPIGFQECEPEP